MPPTPSPPRATPLAARCLLLALAPSALPAAAPAPSASASDHLLLDQAFDDASATTATFREDRAHASILEISGPYDRLLPDGSPDLAARAAVSQAFLATHDDAYDFLLVFTQFPFDTAGAGAFHLVLRNDVSGIGLDVFDQSPLFGSEGVLRGYTDMARLADYETDPLAPGFERTLSALLHELFHQWGARVTFEDGSPSDALLGLEGSHWSFLFDTGASVHYGNDWWDNGDGTFTSVAAERFLSPLDLYLAGFYAPEEVPELVLLEAPGIDPEALPEPGAVIAATPRTLSIDDVIAAEGPRAPSAADSPHELQAALLYLVRPGSPVSDEEIAALEAVRSAFLSRFIAATGGRGTLAVHSSASSGGGGTPGGGGGGEPHPGPADVLAALAWLRAAQHAEGFWEDLPATRIRDTAAALAALIELDPSFDPEAAARAADWLAQAAAANSDAVARQMRALNDFQIDTTSQRLALLGGQCADGGWGLTGPLGSDPLDTSLAILALAAAPDPPTDSLEGAADYLLARQAQDGGWGPSGGASRIRTTTAALRALAALDRVSTVTEAAAAWLATRQNEDGGFGDSPSTAHETADVLEVLMDLGALDALTGRAGEAAAYLAGTQAVEGSWEGSVFTTALAARALQRFSLPNWRLQGPPEIDPEAPIDGDHVTIRVTLSNNGNVATPAGLLRLFDRPTGGEETLLAEFALAPLEPGEAATLEFAWDTFGAEGEHLLSAVVDPEATTIELSELDNRAELELTVAAAPLAPDLALFAEEMIVSPPAPDHLPAQLALSIPLYNLGSTDARDVQAVLFRGEPGAGGEEVASATVSVPGRSSIALDFLYELTEAGSTTLSIVADPEDILAEADETNNSVSRTLTTTPSYDLEVLPEDLELMEEAVYLGFDATFEVTLRNRGTSDLVETAVDLVVTDGSSTRELPLDPLSIPAGQEARRTVIWRVDLVGALRFVATLDPTDVVPEIDEGNNTANLEFTAVPLDQPNLTVSYQDLLFDPLPAREGSPLAISILVRNTGGVEATDVAVGFYDGDPLTGGLPLDEPVVLPLLAPGESATATQLWPEVPDAAERLIFAYADSSEAIAEFSEEDNVAFQTLEVWSLPDTALAAASLALEPPIPAPGQAVTLTVEVANLGEQEARDLLVRAWDGDPLIGGLPVGGDQTILLLPGGSVATAAFTWTLSSEPGVLELYASADPDGLLREGDETNNAASRSFGVQDEDFFVTEPYFSPDGDGVRDETTLFFALDEAATVRVEVVDVVRERIVRTFEGPELEGIASGDATWDGRDGEGRLARDAMYALRVVDSQGAFLGEATATLDTDLSSLLLAPGTPYEYLTNLSCDIAYPYDVQAPGDEEWAYFYLYANSHPLYPKGVFRRRLLGGELQTLVSSAWLGARNVEQLVVDPEGRKMAFNIASHPAEVWVANSDGTSLVSLRTDFNPVEPGEDIGEADILGFTPDGEDVLVASLWGFIAEYPLTGALPQRWWPYYVFLSQFAWSPDRLRLAVHEVYGSSVALIDLEAGTSEVILDGLPSYYSANLTWSPDGRELAVASYPNGGLLFFDRDGDLLRSQELPTESAGNYFTRPQWRSTGEEIALTGFHDTCTSLELADVLAGTERTLEVEGSCETWPPGDEVSGAGEGAPEQDGYSPGDHGPHLDGGEELRHPVGHLIWDPHDRSLLRFAWDWDEGDEGIPAVAVFLEEEEREATFLEEDWDATFARFSPSGRLLLFDSKHDGEQPGTECFGSWDRYAFRSLMNLTVDLSTERPAGSYAWLLSGTAIDVNFDRYWLEYASGEAPQEWHPIGAPREAPVVEGYLTSWVPPGPGTWWVRLTAADLGGNTAHRERLIVSSDSPDITDISVEPPLFSPNGDGVLDELAIQYRVLQPTHVQIHIFDAEDQLVRSFERDHPTVGEIATILWDGRDELGHRVPDGDYSILVQQAEFFFAVDATAPEVAVSYGGFLVDGDLELTVFHSANDGHLDEDAYRFERGEGAMPGEWEAQAGGRCSDGHLPDGTLESLSCEAHATVEQFVGASFRVSAGDLAGNAAATQTGVAPEAIRVTGAVRHEVDPETGELRPFEWMESESFSLTIPFGPVRFRLTEGMRADLAAVWIEYRLSEGDEPWVSVPVAEFLDPVTHEPSAGIPQPRCELVWDLEGVVPGKTYGVRLRAVDVEGSEQTSQTGTITTDGLLFHGRVAPGHVDPILQPVLQEAGLDPYEQLVFWGEEYIAAPLRELTMFLSSDEDPRYETPQAFAPAAVTEGLFVFAVEEWQACTLYQAFVVAVTEPLPGEEERTILSPVKEADLPCLDLTFAVSPVTTEGCDDASPVTERTVTLRPRSLDGAELLLLSLYGPDEGGERTLLHTVNGPQSGATYEFVLSFEDLLEGAYQLEATLSNVRGEEVAGVPRSDHLLIGETGRIVVDRTPPSLLRITYPLEGQAVCPNSTQYPGVLEVQGEIEDGFGVVHRVEYGEGSDPAIWQPAHIPYALPLGHMFSDEDGGLGVPGGLYDAWWSTPLSTYFKDWGGQHLEGLLDHILADGEITVRARAADNGGQQLCDQVTFFLDAAVVDWAMAVDRTVFSPNNDDVVDDVTLNVEAGEPTTIDAGVYPGAHTENGWIITGPRVRTLAEGLPVLENVQLPWDGRDEAGAVALDGTYVLTINWHDGCGNAVLDERTGTDIDTTAPGVAILSPTPDTPLPMIVSVFGTVTDPHLSAWALEYGEGADPENWIPIAGDDEGIYEPDVLGEWNTFGLAAGQYTLRLVADDSVGNRGEFRVTLELDDRTYLITYLEADPPLFSPNGDGRRETTAIRFGLQFEATVTLSIVDELGDERARLLDEVPRQPGAWVEPWDGSGLPTGRYAVRLRAALADDPTVIQTEEVHVVLDRTAPTVAIARPQPDSFVPSTSSIFGTISDERMGLWTISIAEDPLAPFWQEVASGKENRIDYAFAPLTGLAEGDWALRTWATDEAEIETEVVFAFGIDDTPPTVSLTAPPVGTHLGALLGPIEVSGEIQEDHLDSWKLEVGAGAEPTSWIELTGGEEIPSDSTLWLWDVAGAPEGDVTLRLSAHDRAGHEAAASVPLVIDNTPPVAEITDPVAGDYVTEPLPIRGTADDLNLTEYKLAIAPQGTASFSDIGVGTSPVVGGTLMTWTLLPPDGPYDLRLAVRDHVGHEAEVALPITVDTASAAPPTGLTAELLDGEDARLEWQPNAESDLAGYHVYRNGLRLTPAPISETTYLDPDLPEGTYIYTVTALDLAGHESAPSAPAVVHVDRTPPAAVIFAPAPGARVAGLVEVTGTAASAGDFAQYRLWAIDQGSGSPLLVASSTVPVQAGLLGEWPTYGLPEGAPFRLRLEAEDLSGNVATAEVDVTVDNLPPAPPTGLVASVSGSNVHLTWNANTEPDLAGYLLFRDGQQLGGQLTVRVYDDVGVPDGTYEYRVHAIDQAGNLSGPSNPRVVTIDTHAPHAVIVVPEAGTSFDGLLYVLATSPDQDIAQVLFQIRAAGVEVWDAAGDPVVAPPFDLVIDSASLDPPLVEGNYDLQAVATDAGGLTDPSPTPITVTYTDVTPPEPPFDLAARVNAGDVTLSWSPVTDGDLAGYLLYRTGTNGVETAIPVDATLEPAYVDVGLPEDLYTYRVAALDGHGNESEASDEVEALVYTPSVRQPLTPRLEPLVDLTGSGEPDGSVTGELVNGGGSFPLPPTTTDGAGAFAFHDLTLAQGSNSIRLRITDLTGNVSKDAVVPVDVGTPPSAPTGLAAAVSATTVDLTWNANPEPNVVGYRPFRDGAALLAEVGIAPLAASASSSPSSWPAENAVDGDTSTYWRPEGEIAGQWLEVSWSEPAVAARVELAWYTDGSDYVYAADDFELQVWSGAVWVPLLAVTANETATNALELPQPYRTDRLRVVLVSDSDSWVLLAEVRVVGRPLVPSPAATDVPGNGLFRYEVSAVNGYAFESAPSETLEVEVGDLEPPEPVVLSGSVVGFDAELSWTASPSPDVVRYDLYRDGVKILEHTDLVELRAFDFALPNGTYTYVVRAVDGASHESVDSNAVVLDVAVQPSFPLTVAAVPEGRALDLYWEPPEAPVASYRLLRALESGGPWEEIALTTELAYRDAPLADGTTYFYVAFALDAGGTTIGTSNVADGTPQDTVAPAPPGIHYPVVPGVSLLVDHPSIGLAATAEPAATVEFSREGVSLGKASAGAEGAFFLHDTPPYTLRLSPDGSTLWGTDFDAEGNGPFWRLHHFATGHDEWILETAAAARWTADGLRLVYVTEDGSIRVYDVASRQSEEIASAEEVDFVAPSPALDRLAVDGIHGGFDRLWIVDLAIGSWTAVTDWSVSAEQLEWSPTGTHFAYGASLVDAATAEQTSLPAASSAWAPSWAPDGSALLYPVYAGGGIYQVRRYRLADGVSEQVTFDPAGAKHAQWSPQGGSFAYLSGTTQILEQDWATGERRLLYEAANCSNCALQWVAGGPLLVDLYGNSWLTWRAAGLATLSATHLQPGVNSITAVARDAAGNASAPASPITVERTGSGLADLAVTPADLAVVPAAPLVGEVASASITVHNLGAEASPESELTAFVQGPAGFLATILAAAPVPPLPPGGSFTAPAAVLLDGEPGIYELIAFADPFDRVEEEAEENNVASRSFPVLPEAGAYLTLATDRPVYGAGESLVAMVTLAHAGAPLAARLEAGIEDAQGIPVAPLLDESVVLDYGDLLHWQPTWNIGSTWAGPYRAAARLRAEDGALLAEALAPFDVAESFELAAGLESASESYDVGETVELAAAIDYLEGNTMLEGLAARVDILDSLGTLAWSDTAELGWMLPGDQAVVPFAWPSGGPTGPYRALLAVLHEGIEQAAAEVSFELVAPPPALAGDLELASHEPPFGPPLLASFAVTNGSSQPLTDLSVRLRLLDADTGETLQFAEFTLDLPPGARIEGEASFETGSLDDGEHLVELAAEPPDGAGELTLDVETFVPVDRTAPIVSLLRPVAGGWVGASDPSALAQANDERSGIAEVAASIDAGPWITMAPEDPTADTFRLDLSTLAEGPHALAVRATDGADNTATSGAVDFTVDWTPPSIAISGVEEGGIYEEPVVPVVAVEELHPAFEAIRLDGEEFASGTPVDEPGTHTLAIEAEDLAANRAEAVVHFTITTTPTLDLVVNTANDVDDGACSAAHCSLREAILFANHAPSFDTIRFAIPGLDGVPRVIRPQQPLPPITDVVVVDALTQPGASCSGPEPLPTVVLDGSAAGEETDGIVIAATGVTLRGLTLRSFHGHGVRIDGGGEHVLECNRIGDDGTGSPAAGNDGHGLLLENGTADNAIGLEAGVGLCGTPCNVIGYNGGAGIALAPFAGTGNAIRRNRIHHNDGLGIDLAADGLTANDPSDTDSGANELQNYPHIMAVRAGATSEVDVALFGMPESTFLLDLFRVDAANADRSGAASAPPFGEGDAFLGEGLLQTDASGLGQVVMVVPFDLSTSAVTATATEATSGDTSEFSAAFSAHMTHAVIASFEAYVAPAGGFVRWRTSSEAGTLGFDVYRYVDIARAGSWERVNARLVDALLESPQGALYRVGVDDLTPGERERFVLVEVEVSGARRLYGPFEVAVEPLTIAAPELPPGASSRHAEEPSPVFWRDAAPEGSLRVPAEGTDAVKLAIRSTGLYRVRAAEIAAAAGADETTVRQQIRTGALRLTRRGLEVAWRGVPDGSALQFWGLAPEDPYAPESIYWLSFETGTTMTAANGGAPLPQPGGSFRAERTFEENVFAGTVVALDPDEDFWFWRGLSAGDPVNGYVSLSFEIARLDPEGAGGQLEVEFYGASHTGIAGEHVVEVRLGGILLGSATWEGFGWHRAAFAVPSEALVEGENLLELTAVPVPGVPYSFAYLNRFTLTYAHLFEAEQGTLLLASDGQPVITVDRFLKPNPMVLDVTDPLRPLVLRNLTFDRGSGHRVSFVPAPGPRRYWIGPAAAAGTPSRIVPERPSDLQSSDHTVDLVVVGTPEFLDALEPLLAHRATQGLRVLPVEIEDVYDEFNFGEASPHALEALVETALASWAEAPRWLLLAGAGTFDYRDYQRLGGNFVPPLLVRTPGGLYSADGLFGDVAAEDGVPDLAVGRIPAKTVEEMATYAAKAVAYETQGVANWLSSALLVADDRDGAADFGADTLALAASLPEGTVVHSLLLDELQVSDLRQALFAELDAGAGLLHYLGHAGVTVMAAEPILAIADVPPLANAPRLPVVLAPTCVAVRHELPGFRSLGESLVLEVDGGAIAMLASSGLSQHGAASQLSPQLGAAWASYGAESLGELLLRSYDAFLDGGGSPQALRTLTLLGDPALRPPQ